MAGGTSQPKRIRVVMIVEPDPDLDFWLFSDSGGQFIGSPQTFVELQLRFKLHFPSVKIQFEM